METIETSAHGGMARGDGVGKGVCAATRCIKNSQDEKIQAIYQCHDGARLSIRVYPCVIFYGHFRV